MKIELKRISHNERMSEETNCFVADVYIDGIKAGDAQNRGHGGNTDVNIHLLTPQKRAEVEAWVKAQPPHVYPASPGMKEFSVPFDLEVSVDNLLEAYLAEKHSPENQEKKWIKTKVVFTVKGDKDGEYRTLKLNKGQVYTKAHKDFLVKKYGDKLGVIINEKHGQVAV